jgi:ABC-2 type transport system permease protein
MVPGLLMAILQQVILLGIALTWTGEKESHTLPELFSISRNPWQLMLGKGIPYLLINAIVAEFYLRVLFPLNDIPMEGAWWIAIPFTFLFVATIVSWGMWSSALFKTRLFATQALMFVAMPSFILSGFTWPKEALPTFLRWVSTLLPLTHFVNSFRSIYLGGAPLKYVISDIGILILFLVANIALSLLLIRRMVNQTHSASDLTS